MLWKICLIIMYVYFILRSPCHTLVATLRWLTSHKQQRQVPKSRQCRLWKAVELGGVMVSASRNVFGKHSGSRVQISNNFFETHVFVSCLESLFCLYFVWVYYSNIILLVRQAILLKLLVDHAKGHLINFISLKMLICKIASQHLVNGFQ